MSGDKMILVQQNMAEAKKRLRVKNSQLKEKDMIIAKLAQRLRNGGGSSGAPVRNYSFLSLPLLLFSFLLFSSLSFLLFLFFFSFFSFLLFFSSSRRITNVGRRGHRRRNSHQWCQEAPTIAWRKEGNREKGLAKNIHLLERGMIYLFIFY
jgi:hypothetical protein